MTTLENFMKSLKERGVVTDMIHYLRSLRNQKLYNLVLFIGIQLYPYYSYNHEFMNEIAICMYYTGKYLDSWNLYNRILDHTDIVDEHIRIYGSNSNASFQHIFKPTPLPIESAVLEQIRHNTSTPKMVTFSITTCKRYDLFVRTMDSFIQNCKDIHLISRWICVDDNSSEEERKEMHTRYPFFEFVWKTPEEKGHPESMNHILKRVDTPYLFHMEDDWQFITPRNYISDCLQVLQENNSYGQCLVNRCYAETMEDYATIGADFLKTKNNLTYLKHHFEPSQEEFMKKYGQGPNCAYWMHYSLRPGLTRVSALRTIGEYKSGVSHFEKEYSQRYYEHGYRTTFLERVHCIHIGRLTSEIQSNVPNAYTLNGTKQF